MHFGKGRRVGNMQKHSLLMYDPTDNWLLLHATVCWDKREGGGMKAKTNWCCRKNAHKAPGSAEECSKHDWLQSCFAKKVEHRLICFCRAERNVSSLKICRYHPPLPSFNFGFDLPYLQIFLIYDMDNGYIHHLPSRRSILVFCSWPKRAKSKVFQKVCKSRQILISRHNMYVRDGVK